MEFRVGSPAPEAVLFAADQREVRIADLAAEGPAVLVFLRHFG